MLENDQNKYIMLTKKKIDQYQKTIDNLYNLLINFKEETIILNFSIFIDMLMSILPQEDLDRVMLNYVE